MPVQSFTDELLSRYSFQVEQQIVRELCPLSARVSISITAGTANYAVPNSLINVRRVTWKGKKLYPLNQLEGREFDPRILTREGEPDFYLIGFDAIQEIRLYPVPNETIPAAGVNDNLYHSDIITDFVIIDYCYIPQGSTSNFVLPNWLTSRAIRAGVLSRAFRKEGREQNLQAADYYEEQFQIIIRLYKTTLLNMHNAVYRNVGHILGRHARNPRPTLAADFRVLSPATIMAENGLPILNEDGNPITSF